MRHQESRIKDQESLARYHRQILLPGFGEEGQRRLLSATALVVGCGALGTVIANTLSRAGVGHLVVVDRDFIEITNLQRQVLFDEKDVEHALPKAEAVRRKIAAINSEVKVTAVIDDLNHTNIESIAEDCDVLIDGVDNFETRFLINDTAVKLGIPYVYGGAVGTVGMTYAILPHTPIADAPWERAGRATPCLRCIFEQAPPPGMNPTCETAGVLGPSVSVIASYESAEALKILTGNWSVVSPTMLHVDLWENSVRQFNPDPAYDQGDCDCCKKRNFEYLEGRFISATTTLCGRNAVQIAQPAGNGHKVNFDEIAERLRPHGEVWVNRFMLRAQITDGGETYELTLFSDGRAIIRGTDEPHTARGVYARYIGA